MYPNDEAPYLIDFFRKENGSCPVQEFVRSFPISIRRKIAIWLERLRIAGPHLVRPYADVLDGPIRELRIAFGRIELRLLYFIHEKTIVVTQGFLKKTRWTDPREIERAYRRRAEWLQARHRES